MKIGTFTQEELGYIGYIDTAGLCVADVRFIRMPVKRSSGPDFVILAAGDHGQFELGAAWAKTSQKGNPYLSVKFDSPAFVAPINCALTKQADGSYALVWSRDARKDEEQAAASPVPMSPRHVSFLLCGISLICECICRTVLT